MLATFYVAEAFSTAERKMGRQAAGEGLLSALVRGCRTPRFPVVATRQENLADLRHCLQRWRPGLGLHLWPLDKLDRLQGIDALLVADPSIARWSWSRQWAPGGASSYSLIGLTHTLCSLGALEALRAIVAAPVEPWDALICTSQAARAAVEVAFAHEAERLARRFGAPASAWRPPRLPVIPLGCNSERFAALADQYGPARRALAIPEGQPVVLFVGRLELHAKAHPGVMLTALARASAALGFRPRLLVVGTARSAPTAQAWQEALAHFNAHFDTQRIDGERQDQVDAAWAAADLFVSLADSLQETFGLTPVEAMARGLPVIASDWDGYRDTVQHGQTGLLIPTRQPDPAGPHRLADLALERLNYDVFMADLMRQVVVDEEALLAALLKLLPDPALRRRLGQAGRERAQALYSWDRIVAQIHGLAASLNEERRAAAGVAAPRSPLPGPWQQFRSWASATVPREPLLQLDPARFQERCRQMAELAIYSRFSSAAEPALALPALAAVVEVLQRHCESAAAPLQLPAAALAQALPQEDPAELERSLLWLAKIGALSLGPPAAPEHLP